MPTRGGTSPALWDRLAGLSFVFVLPRGSSGFGDGAPPPASDLAALRTGLARLGREARRIVQPVELPGLTSFAAYELRHDYEPTLWLVASKSVPIAGWTEHDPRNGASPRIVDPGLDQQPLAESGWKVLTASEATEKLRAETTVDLADAEIHEMKYWKPATAAEVLFNRWD